jgi:hypothetical protein
MTKLSKMSMAAVLAFMLAPSALAGITDTPPVPGPPPEPPSATSTETPLISDAQPVATPNDPVLDIALDLMQSALSLL